MKKNLVVLADFGLDDAAAVAHLLANRQMFARIDILTVGGNVSAQKSFVNAKKLLRAIGCSLEGIRLVDTSCILQRHNELPDVHGGDGMGSIFTLSVDEVECVEYDTFIGEFDPMLDTVLSLGTLTVTRDIIERRGQIKNLIIMAGLEKAKPNFEGLEFNQALDIESCAFCYKTPHVVATLDTCRAAQFNLIDFVAPPKCAFAMIVNRAVELARARHPDNAFIYDLIASLYITIPKIFATRECLDPCGNKINQLYICKEFDFENYLRKFM